MKRAAYASMISSIPQVTTGSTVLTDSTDVKDFKLRSERHDVIFDAKSFKPVVVNLRYVFHLRCSKAFMIVTDLREIKLIDFKSIMLQPFQSQNSPSIGTEQPKTSASWGDIEHNNNPISTAHAICYDMRLKEISHRPNVLRDTRKCMVFAVSTRTENCKKQFHAFMNWRFKTLVSSQMSLSNPTRHRGIGKTTPRLGHVPGISRLRDGSLILGVSISRVR